MLTMEALIEDTQRLTSYQAEVGALRRLGLSFSEWKQLPPPLDAQADASGVMYITLGQPIRVASL